MTKTFREHFRNFASESTIHGVAHLKNSSKIHVGFYAVLLLTGSSFLLFAFVVGIVDFYVEGESYVDIHTEQKQNLDFPAVTICSPSYYKRSAFQSEYPNINVSEFSKFSQLAYLNISLSDINIGSELNTSELFRFYETSLHYSYENFGYQIEDIAVKCWWKSRLFNCSEYFSMIASDRGTCFTFHSQKFAQENGVLQTEEVFIKGGLTLMLDANPTEYLYGDHLLQGFYVLVHDQSEFPSTTGRTVFIGTGQTTNIAVAKEIRTQLNPPYSKHECISNDGDIPVSFNSSLVQGYSYSPGSCIMCCFMAALEESCNCSYIHENVTQECTFIEYTFCFVHRASGDEYQHCLDSCKPRCVTVSYETSLSTAAFPDPRIVELAEILGFPVTSETEIRNRMLQLNVYYTSLNERYITQHPRYKLWDVFASFGGLMGLCLGVSLISVLEFCEFMFKTCFIAAGAVKRKENTVKSSNEVFKIKS